MTSDYGFILSESIDEDFYSDFKNKYEITMMRRRERWLSSENKILTRSRMLKRFIRKGIPNELRENIWMKYSGADERMADNPGLFKELIDNEIDPYILKIISADISRTFPENVKFMSNSNDASKVKSLENVLKAFASQNPDIGYCQGLNYVAALLLLVISSEEKVFWLFDTIVTKFVQAYYIPGMESVQVDCFVLEDLIRKKRSKVYHAIKQFDTSCIVMCTKWFVCLYVDVLPVETTMRIFDCLIYEGDKMLFRVALGLINLNYKKIVNAQSFPEFFDCFKDVTVNQQVVDCHKFMKKIFKQSNPLPYKMIKKLRKSNLLKLNSKLLTN